MSSPRKPAHPDKGNSMSISPFIIFGGIKTLMDHSSLMGFPGGSDGKESACNGETPVRFLGWKDPLEKEMATHSSILAWRIPWQKSLVRYSPWGHKELDTTEWLTFSLSTKTFKEFFFFLNKTLLRLGQVKGWWYMNISFISRIFGLKMNQRVSLLFIFVFCQNQFLECLLWCVAGLWFGITFYGFCIQYHWMWTWKSGCHKRMDWEIKNQVWRDKG